jgi:tetratricopeptide (TPR) repeat protein
MKVILMFCVSFWIKTTTFAKAEKAEVPVQASRVTQLKIELQKKPQDFPLLLQLAEELNKANQPRAAADLLWPSLEKLNLKGFYTLVESHELLKDWAEVIRAGGLALAKFPNEAALLTRIGNAHFMRLKMTDAKESLKKAIEINKTYLPAYEAMAKVYEKNPYELRILYQDMVEVFGPKASFLTKLCAICTNDGDNEQGEQLCKQGVQVDATIADNHVNLGVIAKQKGEAEKARILLRAAAEKFQSSEFAQFQYANFLESEKNDVDSYKYYERCLAIDPDSERCLLGFASTAVQLQKNEKSHTAFIKLCRKSGRKNSLAVRKAIKLLRQRKDSEWSEKFERVAERCSSL